jgi:hypothetical protein
MNIDEEAIIIIFGGFMLLVVLSSFGKRAFEWQA